MCVHILQHLKTGWWERGHLRARMTPLAAAAFTACQAPEKQLLHQQALTVAEYLMLHLFKAPLRFRSNLHNQGGRGVEGGRAEGGKSAPSPVHQPRHPQTRGNDTLKYFWLPSRRFPQLIKMLCATTNILFNVPLLPPPPYPTSSSTTSPI